MGNCREMSYVEPQFGKLYRTTRAFRVQIDNHRQRVGAWGDYKFPKGAVFMLVGRGNDQRLVAFRKRRIWTDGHNRDSFELRGTDIVESYNIIYGDRVFEVGFRKSDWGDALVPCKTDGEALTDCLSGEERC